MIESKRIVSKRKLLRNFQSISESQSTSAKSSLKNIEQYDALKDQIKEIMKCYQKFIKLIKHCESVLISLINDLEEIVNNTKINKKSLKMILEGLLENHLKDDIENIKKEINKIFSNSPLKEILNMNEFTFKESENLLTERKSTSQTPETVVKKSFRSLKKIIPSSKTSLKLPKENKQNIKKQISFKKINKEEIQNPNELKKILKQSKQEYKNFLRSLGWTEDRIEEIINQENYLLNSETNDLIKNSPLPSSSSAITKTLNVLIKEYKPEADNENDKYNNNNVDQDYDSINFNTNDIKNINIRRNPANSDSDFYSKKTNNCFKKPL